jgi:hypothetical protein
MRRVLLAQAACLALCGHGAGPTEGGPSADCPAAGSTSGTVPSAEIFFPRAFSAGFEAEGIGKLVVDGAGRLRLGSGESTAPLWMRGWGLETADGGPRVLDAGGRTVGRVGGKVKLSGGYITDRMVEDDAMVDGRTVRELLERCPGDYVLVSGHE